ncbi:MAG: TetR-like C-terminal domain-containing protein [Candidatus Nanopelagicales bacterium]
MSEAAHDPEVAAQFTERFGMRIQLAAVAQIQRAMVRGEIPAQVIDPYVMAVPASLVIHQLLFTGTVPSRPEIVHIVDTIVLPLFQQPATASWSPGPSSRRSTRQACPPRARLARRGPCPTGTLLRPSIPTNRAGLPTLGHGNVPAGQLPLDQLLRTFALALAVDLVQRLRGLVGGPLVPQLLSEHRPGRTARLVTTPPRCARTPHRRAARPR